MIVHITEKSGNSKTGPILTTMIERDSCPTICPFYNKGCYSLYGPCKMNWDKVQSRGVDWDVFCFMVEAFKPRSLWRYGIAGDLPGKGNRIDKRKITKLVKTSAKSNGYCYTHKPVLKTKFAKQNKELIKYANDNGFCINLSANNLNEADRLVDLNIGPVVVVLPKDSPKGLKTNKGNKVVKCPAELNSDFTCADCGLCAKIDRKIIIGFEAHGAASKTVSEIAKG